MIKQIFFRRLAFGLLTGVGLVVAAITAPMMIGSISPVQAQVSAEFQEALGPYGEWRRHPRWGEVWVPNERARDWRPYEAGHWVYTDEWGWFWDTDDSEADWGWITYHYGRWMHDASGWFWIPGDEWGPAWVDWRYSNDYVGWAPLPPDDVEVEYESEPTVWVFVAPRYLTEPRWRTYVAPPQRRVEIFRSSRVVNRTVVFQGGGRAAVNPGISPGFIASVTRRPVQSYRVSPHVLPNTRGVTGAVAVRPQDLRAHGARDARVSVQKTNVVIKPEATPPPAPPALGKGEKGRLGNRPPHAAQGAMPATQTAPATQQQQQRQPGQSAPAAGTPVPQQERGGQRPGQTPPGAAAPSNTPAAQPQAKPSTRSPPASREERREQRTSPPKGTAAPQPGERKEERGSAPKAAPAVPQREERREEHRAPAPSTAPARPTTPPQARPAQPQVTRPAAPAVKAPSQPAPPKPAAQPPAVRPAAPPPPAQRSGPRPQAPRPPAAAKPEEKK